MPERHTSAGGLQIGRVVPWLIAIFIVVDLGTRFLSVDRFTFRASEAMLRFPGPYTAGTGPFQPNKSYRGARTYGDLAAAGNKPHLQEYRSEIFTTDPYGFRNSPAIATNRSISVLLVGDSYSIGYGANDDQTLAVCLSRLMGTPVYNAAGMDTIEPVPIEAVAQRLGMKRGLVIEEHLERVKGPKIPDHPTRFPKPDGGLRDHLRHMKVLWLGYERFSPVKILCERCCKILQNDRLLPNPSAHRVTVGQLNGDDALLFFDEEFRGHTEHQLEEAVRYWTWLDKELKRHDQDLLVVLVPDKLTVYQSLLDKPVAAPDKTMFYLDRLEKRLWSAGVNVLNLTAPFQSWAASHRSAREYLYWRDDTHWNVNGIRLAAETISPAAQKLLAQYPAASGKENMASMPGSQDKNPRN